MTPPILGLSLDLDDTLWPVAPALAGADAALVGWFAREAPKALAGHDPGSLAALRRAVFAERPDLAHDFSALRRLMIERLLVAGGYPATLADAAFEAFFAARNAVRFYDDVLPALERLAARFPIVAVTNGNADLARMPVAHHFRATVYARQVGHPKPHRAIFDHACAVLSVPPARVLHVGDDLALDVEGARAAGLQAIWMDRGGRDDDVPAPRVTDFLELADRLGC